MWKALKSSQTFICGVDVIDVDLKFFVRGGLQHLLPGRLLPLFYVLFTLLLVVQSEPEEKIDDLNIFRNMHLPDDLLFLNLTSDPTLKK